MKPDRPEFRRAHESAIRRGEIVRQPKFAVGLADHQPIVVVGGPEQEAFFLLLGAMLAKRVNRDRWQRDAAMDVLVSREARLQGCRS